MNTRELYRTQWIDIEIFLANVTYMHIFDILILMFYYNNFHNHSTDEAGSSAQRLRGGSGAIAEIWPKNRTNLK